MFTSFLPWSLSPRLMELKSLLQSMESKIWCGRRAEIASFIPHSQETTNIQELVSLRFLPDRQQSELSTTLSHSNSISTHRVTTSLWWMSTRRRRQLSTVWSSSTPRRQLILISRSSLTEKLSSSTLSFGSPCTASWPSTLYLRDRSKLVKRTTPWMPRGTESTFTKCSMTQ